MKFFCLKNGNGLYFPTAGVFSRLLLVQYLLFSFSFSNAQQTASKDQETGKLRNSTWISDNGNGTFTNPLFYDEFSDPDLIRVGDDFYLTGTTMHAMPGLPVLHSKDLVNWDFLTYACDRLDFGPEFRLENGKEIYGQGIWAPSIRYHNDTYYIFTNVNRYGTQVYTATNPSGPWKHYPLNATLHDLSVLFDDDGKIYAIWGYNEIRMVELNSDVTGTVPGTERVIIPIDQGAGEGSHFYKIDGKYYITLTNYDPLCYQVTARADKPEGPYEITVTSAEENLGVATTYRMPRVRLEPPFDITHPDVNFIGSIPMHQGGLVQTQTGEWWGFSMMDFNSVGRTLNLSPVTWQDGWPYFGLPGNLTRSPKTWLKPNTGHTIQPHAPYERSDDFSAGSLNPVWQWNHCPDDNQWSLTKRKGYLRLNALPAKNFWQARNTLTQRAVGPQSVATSEVDLQGLKEGDVAGLALLNLPYSWIGVVKTANGLELQQFDQRTDKVAKIADLFKDNISKGKAAKNKPVTLWFRASCNFDTDKATFSYSTDGKKFQNLGEEYIMVYQLKTFQGVRFALFNYNTKGEIGGTADFNSFEMYEPQPGGLTQPIPYGKTIQLTSLGDSTILVNWRGFLRPVSANDRLAQGNVSHFQVINKGNGRIALKSLSNGGYVTVKGHGLMAEIRIEPEDQGDASTFQWQDMLRGDLMLMSLKTHRYLFVDPNAKSLCSADAPGTRPDRKDGACFSWKVVGE
jgi:xylan 1,4-beta-xylosidase